MKTHYFKHNATLLGIVCLFLSTACGCTKENLQEQLPPITQTGANTFGCIVNGKVFIPKDKTGYYAPGGGRPRGLLISGSAYFSITARNYDDIYLYRE